MNEDHKFLLEALDLAAQRKGYTSPNPAVGAIIIKEGRVLGRGFHFGTGSPHAEVEALKNLGIEAAGATLYVTLEPCCHFGKTPPCTDLLKSKPLGRVVYGFVDPNPIVSGKGGEILNQAGIKTDYLPLKEIQDFYKSYAWWTGHQKTWLTGKLALSQDEKVCSADGSPVKITGELADRFTHFRRAQADVIVTSISTLMADDPRLNVRSGSSVIKKPVWILDQRLSFSPECQLMDTAQSVTLVHGNSASEERRQNLLARGIDCVAVSELDDGLCLSELALRLGERGYHEAWCEFGPRLFSAFAKNKLFQEIFLYHSTQVKIANGREAFNRETSPVLEAYKKVSEEKLGCDIKESWNLK